jgi:hypothetical protein
MTTRHHQVITKIVIGAAVLLGTYVAGAAPAYADPNLTGPAPNPYSGLTCSCRQATPPGSPAQREEIELGLREGHSAWLPGPSPQTRPRQPQ